MSSASAAPSWSFIHVTDMHIGSPRSYRFQPAWNDHWETARRQIMDLRPDLVLCGGDMTRDGSTHREELEIARDALNSLGCPVHSIPGNHEVGNKWSADSPVAVNSAYVARYREVFGASHWSFVQGEGENAVRFSGLDAFLLGSGLPEETELRAWLDGLMNDPDCPHHVWMMHPSLFAEDFDEADYDPAVDRTAWYFGLDRRERFYLWDVFKRTGTTHVLSGHIHCRRHIVVDGVDFHFGPATAFPQWGDRWPDGDDRLGFLRFEVSRGELRPEFVPLAQTSDRVGYGPGGNPPVEGRDYSVAWEQPPLTPAV